MTISKNINKERIGKDGVCIVIPSRLEAARLPNKPLLLVNGVPIILLVLRQARKLPYGEPIVATANAEIAKVVENDGGIAIMTNPDLPSGSDRIFAALSDLDLLDKFKAIVNLQGDMAKFDPSIVIGSVNILKNNKKADVATAVIPLLASKANNPDKVKAVCDFSGSSSESGDLSSSNVLYFSRSAVPYKGPYYLHLGIYAYRPESLINFIQSPVSELEKSESLEQIRGLNIGLSYWAYLANCDEPLSIDTDEDYKNLLKSLT